MTSKELEKELQAIDPNFTIVDNANRPGLSNIFYEGVNYDLPVVSTEDIRDEVDNGHRYTFPNGMSARFWTKGEVLDRVKGFLGNVDNIKKEYED